MSTKREHGEPTIVAENFQSESLAEPFLKGTVQEPAYRDVYFGYAFILQSIGVLIASMVYGREIFMESDNNRFLKEDGGASVVSFVVVLVASLLGAMVSTCCMLKIMTLYSHRIVEVSFCAAPCLLMLCGLSFMALDPEMGLYLLASGVLFAAISACVYLCYKRFIPFAASTLRTAATAVQVHQGLFVVAFGAQAVTFLATTVFLVAMTGLFLRADRVGGEERCGDLYDDSENPNDMCLKDPPVFGIIVLLFCSFWTQQVIQNVVHCTTAGTVGSWWFSGLGDPSWCSREITGSLGRATTYSFGSICFGSLLVAILQTLERMAESARRNRDSALLACILECILNCMRAWLEYFNSWAFVYVGLYGYDYLTAGKNVVHLFQNRGWSTFASDRLIFRVLYFSVLGVALFSGGVAALVDTILGGMFDNSQGVAFITGFILGLILAQCSLFVIESAVRTVIVSFAESPADFGVHHPELCDSMKNGWAAAYPDVWTEEYDLRFEQVTTLPPPSYETPDSEEKKALIV